jgi:hypothetical protein
MRIGQTFALVQAPASDLLIMHGYRRL